MQQRKFDGVVETQCERFSADKDGAALARAGTPFPPDPDRPLRRNRRWARDHLAGGLAGAAAVLELELSEQPPDHLTIYRT